MTTPPVRLPDTASLYDRHYFETYHPAPYARSELFLTNFATVADGIVREINPASVLDVGCAMGLLVEALRERGVEAFGIDVSQYAIDQVREDIRPYCSVGSVLQPIERRFDLIVCIEVLEHLPVEDARRAVQNVCAATDDVLFSSTPQDFEQDTHINVQPPEYWATLFAERDFVRDVDFDGTAFLPPWAMRLRKKTEPWPRVVGSYERRLWHVSQENRGLKSRALASKAELADYERRLQDSGVDRNEVEALRQTVAEQNEHLDALNDRLQFMSDREAELHRMLVDAHEQLLLRDQAFASAGPRKDLEELVEERTAWAQQLNTEVATRDAMIRDLQGKLEEQTTWAQQLDSAVRIRDDMIRDLQSRLGDQAAWTQPLSAGMRIAKGRLPSGAALGMLTLALGALLGRQRRRR